jgi:hypothetical protein
MGIGFAIVLIASLMLFAVPAQADPYDPLHPMLPNMWAGFPPTPGAMGAWFFDPDISQVGPLAQAINGDIYAYVAGTAATANNPGTNDIAKSTDGGRTWTFSGVPFYYFNTTTGNPGGPVVDMVCSSMSEDVLYLTDGNYVYRSINGAISFDLVAPEDLEKKLVGACGIEITGQPITCIDLGYDAAGQPMVFIGTRYVTGHFFENGDPAVGSVFWIADQTFSSQWTDLQVRCHGCCPKTYTAEYTSVQTDGSVGPFNSAVNLGFLPIYPATVSITNDSVDETFTDPDGDGILTGDNGGTGTINYVTGAWSVTFGVAPSSGEDIWVTYDSGYGCYDVYAVGCAPGFASVSKIYAVVTAPLTSVTFTASTAATVELRSGDDPAGAIVWYDSRGCTGLGGTSGVTNGNAGGTITLPFASGNGTETITFDGAGTAGTINFLVQDETVSWRMSAGAGATFCGGTHVISNIGTVCAWSEVSELKWDCMWSFPIEHASRIMYPSFYATDPTLFVGVAALSEDFFGEGGDVYRVTDTAPIVSGCIDLNVQGFVTGCLGLAHANICSLDLENDQLVAGAWDAYKTQSPTRTYYSADGGWTWSPSLKDPTGTDRCYVLFGGSIVAGTRGCDCAFSLDCGPNPAQFFNQISLISTDIDEVLDLTHSPGYVVDSSTLFALTSDTYPCEFSEIRSLFRWDGTYWERVHSSRFFAVAPTQAACAFANAPLYDWVEVSPDFNTTSCLYMANTGFYMSRSLDAGCSWAPIIYPCLDRPTITAWIVVDEETVLAAGGCADAGNVYRTINHGAQPWAIFPVMTFPAGFASDGVDFDLSIPRGPDSDVLLGDDDGNVFLSQDLGATWAEICDVVGNASFESAHNTYVIFDPGYGVAGDPGETMIYAAAGTSVGRCALDFAAPMFTQDWVYISNTGASCDPFAMCEASGIDAHGDTVLYVADAGSSSQGSVSYVTHDDATMGVRYACVEGPPETLCTCDLEIGGYTITLSDPLIPFECDEPLNVVEYNLECQWDSDIEGTLLVQGLFSGAFGTISINEDSLQDECQLCVIDGGAVELLYAYIEAECSGSYTPSCPTGVWRTLNPMGLMPPVFPFPTVEWEFLEDSGGSFRHPLAACSVYPDDLWLTVTASSNVLWCLDDSPGDSPTDTIWMWDDPLARPVIQIQPADGALLPTTTMATLEWQPLDAATLYQVIVYSYCEACPDNKSEEFDFTTNKTCYVLGGLIPGTTYYWKVRVACDSPFVSKWSDLRSFKTALGAVPYLCAPWCGQNDVILPTNFAWDAVAGATGYEVQVATDEAFSNIVASGSPISNAWSPADPLEYSTVYYWRVRSVKDGINSAWAVCIFTTMNAPVDPPEPPPAVVVEQTEITPVWIWVIIGIGGALTIAVVILIVTTRKVP